MLMLKRSLQIGVLAIALIMSACAPESSSDTSASNKQFPGQSGTGTNPSQGTNNLPQAHWQAIKSQTYTGSMTSLGLSGQPQQPSNFTMSISERSLDGAPYGYVTLNAGSLQFQGYLGLVPGSACSATYCFLSEIKQLSTVSSVTDVSLAINLGFTQNGQTIQFVPQFSAMGFLDCTGGTSCSQVLNSITFQFQ